MCDGEAEDVVSVEVAAGAAEKEEEEDGGGVVSQMVARALEAVSCSR